MLMGKTIESSGCDRPREHRITAEGALLRKPCWGEHFFLVLIGLTWELDILEFNPSPCRHNVNEVDWMDLDEWNSWLKSQVQHSNRSQDIVNFKQI
ncbi:hypothetical protein TNCV_4393411 [Trichonephila clavipes]|nr:hypothetical protein TNCV_4393411 [Trichonephila clavipes]